MNKYWKIIKNSLADFPKTEEKATLTEFFKKELSLACGELENRLGLELYDFKINYVLNSEGNSDIGGFELYLLYKDRKGIDMTFSGALGQLNEILVFSLGMNLSISLLNYGIKATLTPFSIA